MFHFFIQSPAQGETWEGRRGTHSSAYLFWFVYTSPLLLCAIFAPIDHVLLFWFPEIYHIWWIFCEQVSNQTLLPYLTAMSWGSKLVYQELSYPNIKPTGTEGCSDSWNVWLSECNNDHFPLQISDTIILKGLIFVTVVWLHGSFRKTGLLFVVSEFGTHTLASYAAKLELSACLKFSTEHLVPIWAGEIYTGIAWLIIIQPGTRMFVEVIASALGPGWNIVPDWKQFGRWCTWAPKFS